MTLSPIRIPYTKQSSGSKRLERLSVQPQLVDRVYAAILDAICVGRLAPGERITQEALRHAEQLLKMAAK